MRNERRDGSITTHLVLDPAGLAPKCGPAMAVAGATMLALSLHCGGDDGAEPSCDPARCWNSCQAEGRPGGECVGVLCACFPGDDAPPDAPDGDAGEEFAELDDGDATEDAEILADEADGAEDYADRPEDTGPRCLDLAVGWTFNGSVASWSHAALDAPATGSYDPWEHGVPASGPGECRGGGEANRCWATTLAGEYPECQRAYLRSPTLDLSPCAGSVYSVVLVFWHWYEFGSASGSADGGFVEVSGDGGERWVRVTPEGGWDARLEMDTTSGAGCEGTFYMDGVDGFAGPGMASGGRWEQETFPIPETVLTAGFAFRFVFGSDAATSGAGWYVDDAAIVVR